MMFDSFFILIGLVIILVCFLLIYFLGSKVLKLNHEINKLKQSGDQSLLKKSKNQYAMLLAIILIAIIWLIMIVIKFFTIKFD
jgi:ABC-type Fe3+ transport system permease subunit